MSQLQPYQQRVVIEKAELDEKISKLCAFLDSLEKLASIKEGEVFLLSCQLVMMKGYSNILAERIKAFNQPEDFALGKACDLSGEGSCESCQ